MGGKVFKLNRERDQGDIPKIKRGGASMSPKVCCKGEKTLDENGRPEAALLEP